MTEVSLFSATDVLNSLHKRYGWVHNTYAEVLMKLDTEGVLVSKDTEGVL